MATSQKDVIYLDIDDEITAVIEKVQSSASKVVALVLPKRATVFQSIVNMKLLKRTADSAKKHIVLITSESTILPLAGAVGLHVAKTLQSKPVIPAAPSPSDAPVSVDDADMAELEDDKALDPQASIGALAGLPPEDEAIEVDNASDVAPTVGGDSVAKLPFNKKLKVPNFEKFRTRLFLGGAAFVILIVGWIFANVVLPKASITIVTDTTDVSTSLEVTASPSAKELDEEKRIVPAVSKEFKKTDAQKVAATGKKDVGTKASGTVTLSLTDCSKASVTVPAGTTLTAGEYNFITQAEVTMGSVVIFGNCRNSDFKDISTAKVKAVAQNAGDNYNLSARKYTVAGFSNVSASGDAMSGGTTKIVTVVSQQDIDGAKQKIIDAVNAEATQEVSKLLKDEGYFPLSETFNAKEPLVVASPGVDTEAAEVTVNVTLSYNMLGAQRDNLVTVLENEIKKNIDTAKQNILDNGLDNSSIRIDNRPANGDIVFTLQTTASAGVEQNETEIKQAVMGLKKGEVQQTLSSRPGVKEVRVDMDPFWVYKVPKKESKITLVFENQNSDTTNNGE